jgi:uncharacterized protein (TIGR02147 family)
MQDRIDIFEYHTFASYFAAYLEHQRLTRRDFSLRQLCRHTEVKSPSLFTFIASGKRQATQGLLEKLSPVIGWSPAEYAYATLLLQYERTESSLERQVILERLQSIAVPKSVTYISGKGFSLFSKWYYAPILEMTRLQDFRWESSWIVKRLGEKISEEDVDAAIQFFLENNFIEEDPEKKYRLCHVSRRTRDNELRPIVRAWHSEMMKLAQKSLHLQAPEERFITGITLTIDKEKMKEAQELISDFREKFIRTIQAENGNETYQLSVQFFRLTEYVESDPEKLAEDRYRNYLEKKSS